MLLPDELDLIANRPRNVVIVTSGFEYGGWQMDKSNSDKTTDTLLNELAERIAKRLFVNGCGEHAKRLVLELDNGRDGGGWCESAVRDQVAAELAGIGAVLDAARRVVANPAWAGVCDEDVELERALAVLYRE